MHNPTAAKIAVRGSTIALTRAGTGQPLLFLHGGGGGGWLPFMTDLAAQHEVFAPDHPGFGASDTPDWLDNVQDLAYFYLDLFDQLDLRDLDLVGHSLGGWVAAEIAVRNSSRLRSLTLVDAAGIHVPGVAQVDTFLLSDDDLVRALFHDPKDVDAMLEIRKRPEVEDAVLKNRIITAKLTWQPRGYDLNLHKWLHRIDVPTLIVWGANDRLYPKDYAAAWQQRIPGAQMTIIPDCGHVPQVEQRAAFVAALEGFLASMRAAA